MNDAISLDTLREQITADIENASDEKALDAVRVAAWVSIVRI